MKRGVWFVLLLMIAISVVNYHHLSGDVFSDIALFSTQQHLVGRDDQYFDALPQQQVVATGIVARAYLEREDSPVEDEDDQPDVTEKLPPVSLDCHPNSDQREMLRLVNKARSRGRDCGDVTFKAAPTLRWSCRLYAAAFAHSQDMIDYDYFDHEGSDGSTVGIRVTKTGYDWRAVGENIAAGYPDNEQVVENLLLSPTHCENIMDPKFRDFGSAVIATDEAHYYNYWTQVFGAL
jgi:uncharacterized protein YkwD